MIHQLSPFGGFFCCLHYDAAEKRVYIDRNARSAAEEFSKVVRDNLNAIREGRNPDSAHNLYRLSKQTSDMVAGGKAYTREQLAKFTDKQLGAVLNVMRYRYMEGMSAKRQKLYLEMTSKLKIYEKRHTIASEQEGLGLRTEGDAVSESNVLQGDEDVLQVQNQVNEKVTDNELLQFDEDVDNISGETSASPQRSLIDIQKIAPLLKTEPDTAFFWSGRTNGIGGQYRAAEIAQVKGGTTIEMVLSDKKVNMPKWDRHDPSSIKAWEVASLIYAQKASGIVRAVIGKNVNDTSVWMRIEKRALELNENVTQIITIDPETGEETVIFEREEIK